MEPREDWNYGSDEGSSYFPVRKGRVSIFKKISRWFRWMTRPR